VFDGFLIFLAGAAQTAAGQILAGRYEFHRTFQANLSAIPEVFFAGICLSRNESIPWVTSVDTGSKRFHVFSLHFQGVGAEPDNLLEWYR